MAPSNIPKLINTGQDLKNITSCPIKTKLLAPFSVAAEQPEIRQIRICDTAYSKARRGATPQQRLVGAF